MRILRTTALAVSTILTGAALAQAETPSPIFGSATVKLTTPSENRSVVGKGSLADYYGYYGNYYNNLAGAYGNYGFYFKNYSYYYSAYSYASSAASSYLSAYNYQYADR